MNTWTRTSTNEWVNGSKSYACDDNGWINVNDALPDFHSANEGDYSKTSDKVWTWDGEGYKQEWFQNDIHGTPGAIKPIRLGWRPIEPMFGPML